MYVQYLWQQDLNGKLSKVAGKSWTTSFFRQDLHPSVNAYRRGSGPRDRNQKQIEHLQIHWGINEYLAGRRAQPICISAMCVCVSVHHHPTCAWNGTFSFWKLREELPTSLSIDESRRAVEWCNLFSTLWQHEEVPNYPTVKEALIPKHFVTTAFPQARRAEQVNGSKPGEIIPGTGVMSVQFFNSNLHDSEELTYAQLSSFPTHSWCQRLLVLGIAKASVPRLFRASRWAPLPLPQSPGSFSLETKAQEEVINIYWTVLNWS